jgi:hypothetical protein
MNLKLMQQTEFASTMMGVYQYYKPLGYNLRLGDQDLLNIYFAEHPELLEIMECKYNQRILRSRCDCCQGRMMEDSVVLHGNRGAFHHERLLKTIWDQFLASNVTYHGAQLLMLNEANHTILVREYEKVLKSYSVDFPSLSQKDTPANLSRLDNKGSFPRNLASGAIEWLHIPKTGTSFGNTLVSTFCNLPTDTVWVKASSATDIPPDCLKIFRDEGSKVRRRWPIGDHVSLEGRTVPELQKVFTMIRSPGTRLLSAFHFVTHNTSRKNATEEEVCQYVSRSQIAHTSMSAQVKMVVGKAMSLRGNWHTFENPNIASIEDAELGCRNLEIMAFVGISDYWEASICLFHSQYGGEMSDADMLNVRPGRYAKDGLTSVDCNDERDNHLFECAMQIFLARLRLYSECSAFVEYKDFGLPTVHSMLLAFLENRR